MDEAWWRPAVIAWWRPAVISEVVDARHLFESEQADV
jgi:hypothetical protein